MTLAEQFIQQGREEGREQGRQEGLEEGRKLGLLIGQINELEYFLGRPETPVNELVPHTIEELRAILDALKRAPR